MNKTHRSQTPQPSALHILRPTYVPNILKLETVLYSTFLIFVATMIGGVLIMIVSMILGLGRVIPFGLGFFAVLVASLILIPPYVHRTLKANMAATACKFFSDHMLYQTFQWMIFRRRGRILYRNIADITERTNIFQARYNVGDIWFIVPGMSQEAGQRFQGMKIRNVRLSGDLTNFFETVIFENTDTIETVDTPLTEGSINTEPPDIQQAYTPVGSGDKITLDHHPNRKTGPDLLSDVSKTAPAPTGARLELEKTNTPQTSKDSDTDPA